MSNDISYVLKVVDDFSASLGKFKTSITGIDSQVQKASLNVSGLSNSITQQLGASKTSQTLNAMGTGFTKISNDIEGANKSSKFFTQNLIDLGKATGIYMGAAGAMSFGKQIFNAKIQMDSMSASLAAILPRFDKTKSGTQLAAEEIDYLREATNRMGVSFEQALPSYMQFLAGSKSDLATTRKTFEAFAGISRMYGLNSQRFGLVINALSQMQSKGVISMEELRQQLGDSLPGALQMFADAAKMSTGEFTKLVAEGRVGAGLIKIVGENITKTFGQDMVNAAQTLGGKTAVLGNQWLYFKNVLGDQVAPVLSGAVAGLTNVTGSLASMFAAINNQTAFTKLNDDLKGMVTLLRIAKGLMQGMGDIFSGIGGVAKGGFNLATDLVSAVPVIASGALSGNKEEAGRGMSEIWSNMKTHSYQFASIPQKVDVEVSFSNAPAGTSAQIKSKSSATSAGLRKGNTVGGD